MAYKSFNINNNVAFKDNVDIEEALDEAGNGRYNLFVLVACCILNIGATIDLLGYNIIVPAASCDLSLTLTQIGILTSISSAGFLTAIPWGYAADTRGRKGIMLISGIVGSITSILTGFSTSFYMMLMLKLIGSCFSTAALILTVIFLGENTCAKYRNRYLVILNVAHFTADFICFVLAYMILPLDFTFTFPFLTTYKSWRLLALVFTVPSGVGTILMCFLQESPKYLVDVGGKDEAIDVLQSISKINNGMRYVYPIKSLMQTQKTNENISFWTKLMNQIVPIFKPPLLWKTLNLFILLSICMSSTNVFYTWLPAMLNSFFISTNENLNFCQKIVVNITPVRYDDVCIKNESVDTFYSGMIFTFIFIIFNIAVVALVNWKRIVIIGACLISGISCIFINLVDNIIGSIILFLMIQITGVAYGGIHACFVEVFPTSHRSTAFSIGTMFARFICFIGINVVGAVIVNHCQLTFYCWAVYVFCGILIAIFLPVNLKTSETFHI